MTRRFLCYFAPLHIRPCADYHMPLMYYGLGHVCTDEYERFYSFIKTCTAWLCAWLLALFQQCLKRARVTHLRCQNYQSMLTALIHKLYILIGPWPCQITSCVVVTWDCCSVFLYSFCNHAKWTWIWYGLLAGRLEVAPHLHHVNVRWPLPDTSTKIK